MFREIVRHKQALSNDECLQILKQEKRGVLSVLGDDDYPYGVPHNHWYDKETGKLYFHSGMHGHKVDAIKRHDKVSYCVFGEGQKYEGDWALHFTSVIVFGRIEIIDDYDEAMEICRRLSRQFTDDEGYIESEIQRHPDGSTLVFALVPEHITGKRVTES